MSKKLAVIGLGYVGLPLGIEFAKKHTVLGFDTNRKRIDELKNCYDRTGECSSAEIRDASQLSFTDNLKDICTAEIYIITVPTPIDNANNPDLKPLSKACELVGTVLKSRDIVIFESTVFPGATEEICVPILEAVSGLKFNEEFFCGYSPERVNPGDKVNTLTKIKKVTSGSSAEIAKEIDALYKSIIAAGTWLASSIKVAEAAKVIEKFAT